MTPAFVSLLCICIVFVPMFFLTGRGALPVRADGRGGGVRDDRLLHPVAHAGADHGECICCASTRRTPTCTATTAPLPRSRNPLVRFQHGFEARFERVRDGYRKLLRWRCAHRARLRHRLPGLRARLVRAGAVPGRNFFPSVDAGQILLHVRAPVGTRIEETAALFAEIEKAIRQIIPPRRTRRRIVDNIGLPVSGINMTYNNTGTIGPQDGDIQITLSEDHRPPPTMCATLRERAAARASRARPSPSCPPTSSARS